MRKFIHIDMDCFFAAIEMRDNPSLRNIPIAIGGSVESRGVVCTANYLARKYLIHSAMPMATALRLCPHLMIITPRMELYEYISLHVMSIFSRYTDLIEPLSLDEAYLDVTDCRQCSGSAILIAKEIRQTIFDELGLTASAGIAPVKFVAKIASDINKPNGQYVVLPGQLVDFVKKLSVRQIPGVGPKTESRLKEMGLYTCEDIQYSPFSTIIQEFGKFGLMIWQRSHGKDENKILNDLPRKSVGVETTLPQDIHTWDECEKNIIQLFPELVKRLEKYSVEHRVSKQCIKYKFSDFQLTTHEHPYSTLDLMDLLDIAKKIWESRREGRGVRLIGLQVVLQPPQLARQLLLPW